jgi:hypothetical protein
MDESLLCVGCEKPLMSVPIYNANKHKDFPSSFLFCQNKDCERHGLLTVTFKHVEDKRKTVQ